MGSHDLWRPVERGGVAVVSKKEHPRFFVKLSCNTHVLEHLNSYCILGGVSGLKCRVWLLQPHISMVTWVLRY